MIIVTVRRGEVRAVLRVADGLLQDVLDCACRHFGDPGKIERIPDPKPVEKTKKKR